MRFIIHANADEMILAARACQYFARPEYEWPSDRVGIVAYGDSDKAPRFAAKKNRTSITIWSQQVADA